MKINTTDLRVSHMGITEINEVQFDTIVTAIVKDGEIRKWIIESYEMWEGQGKEIPTGADDLGFCPVGIKSVHKSFELTTEMIVEQVDNAMIFGNIYSKVRTNILEQYKSSKPETK